MFSVMLTVPKLTARSDSPPPYAVNHTPCGESFFERDSSITIPSNRSANKENNIPATSGTNRRQSDGNISHQHAQVQYSSVSPASMTSTSMMDDHTSKDTLLLTELLDSSDDEWANTSSLGTDSGKKVSSTSTSLTSSGSRFNSAEFTPCNKRAVATLPFNKATSVAQNKKCNSLNSSFSPQRINTIPNNGNDSKSVVGSNVNQLNIGLSMRMITYIRENNIMTTLALKCI